MLNIVRYTESNFGHNFYSHIRMHLTSSRSFCISALLANLSKRKEWYRRIFFVLCTSLSVPLCILAVYAASKLEFYYFNPDSVQSNFSLLSRGFGNFLKQAGLDASFQAFAQKSDFDQRIKDKRPDLVLVPAWYFQQYGQSLGLTPLLASLENGKPNYTKILMVRKADPFTVDELKGRTVAMTTMGPHTEELLSEKYFKDQGVDFSAMNIIVTPKDADALYALALGQVDAALVGEATLNMVGSVNQRVLEATKELAVSSPVPTPLLCALPGSADKVEVNKMKEMLLEGGDKGTLPKPTDMLHINGWQKVL